MPAGADGNLKIGENDIDKIYIGDREVDAVYLGSNQVWVFGNAPVWSAISLQSVAYNANFSLDLNDFVTGTPTLTITVTGLPSGMSASNGVISGNSTQTGTRTITVTATNSISATSTTFSLRVRPYTSTVFIHSEDNSIAFWLTTSTPTLNSITIFADSGQASSTYVNGNYTLYHIGDITPNIYANLLTNNPPAGVSWTVSQINDKSPPSPVASGTYNF